MTTSPPRIGFDRFIHQDWVRAALRTRSGITGIDELTSFLDSAHSGNRAKALAFNVLKRLWLDPYPELAEYSERGVQIFIEEPNSSVTALTWGMAIASYPYFARVCENVGRLTGLHGDCSPMEIHRRMIEVYGQRETTRLTTNRILRTQLNWGVIQKSDDGLRISRMPSIDLNGTVIAPWLIEGCLRHTQRAQSITMLEFSPLLFPFDFGESLSYTLSRYGNIEIKSDASGNQVAGLYD